MSWIYLGGWREVILSHYYLILISVFGLTSTLWISHAHHMGITCMNVIWVSHAHHIGITWMLYGCHMYITWISHEYHMGVTCTPSLNTFVLLNAWKHSVFGVFYTIVVNDYLSSIYMNSIYKHKTRFHTCAHNIR